MGAGVREHRGLGLERRSGATQGDGADADGGAEAEGARSGIAPWHDPLAFCSSARSLAPSWPGVPAPPASLPPSVRRCTRSVCLDCPPIKPVMNSRQTRISQVDGGGKTQGEGESGGGSRGGGDRADDGERGRRRGEHADLMLIRGTCPSIHVQMFMRCTRPPLENGEDFTQFES